VGPVTVANWPEIQQKAAAEAGFFTYHQVPAVFFPTISTL
jgi:hypothetical protein